MSNLFRAFNHKAVWVQHPPVFIGILSSKEDLQPEFHTSHSISRSPLPLFMVTPPPLARFPTFLKLILKNGLVGLRIKPN